MTCATERLALWAMFHKGSFVQEAVKATHALKFGASTSRSGAVEGRKATTASEARLSSADRMWLSVVAQTGHAINLAALLAAEAASARVFFEFLLKLLTAGRCPLRRGFHLFRSIQQ